MLQPTEGAVRASSECLHGRQCVTRAADTLWLSSMGMVMGVGWLGSSASLWNCAT